MPSRLTMIAFGLIATFTATSAMAQAATPTARPATGAPATPVPADPQFEAAKNFISFYTFNRVAYKQVCDKQAVDVSVFVNTFVNENAGAYAKAMSVLQAHGLSEAKVMAKLQPTIASS